MKKHILLTCNLLIVFSIVVSFVLMAYQDTRTYQQLAENHLENILSLAGTDVSRYIENSMTIPLTVSKTMANDEFLKGWLLEEPKNISNPSYLEELYTYLKAYQEKFNYTIAFCVSAQTGNYYYHGGLNKTVSKNDEHDVWYYNFIGSGQEYDLQVDTDEANNNDVTVFVNVRVEDDDGRLLGVIGVGLQVEVLEELIRSYEKEYDLMVYIINDRGSKNSFDGNTDIFVSYTELLERTGIKGNIEIDKSSEPKIEWFTVGDERICLITKYDDNLGWYLILEKDTDSIASVFQKRVMNSMVLMVINLVVCTLVTTTVFNIYNKRIISIENTDELTGLPNRKMVNNQYQVFIRKHQGRTKTVFMLDIDNFKKINDIHGHLFGNAVLAMVGKGLQDVIKDRGIVARWGGDEFFGIMTVDSKEAKQILSGFMDSVHDNKNDVHCPITVSIGMVEFTESLSLEQTTKKADEALYRSKKDGRNRITVCVKD
jgi:diguanylate cyclase (GGDEF)-like protein